MKSQDLRKKTIKELNEVLTTVVVDLNKVCADILQKKEKNVKKASVLKKDVARIKTIISEKKYLELKETK